MENLPFDALPLDLSPLGIDPLGTLLINLGLLMWVLLGVYAVRLPSGAQFIVLFFLFLFTAAVMFAVDNVVVFYFAWEIAWLFAWAIGELPSEESPGRGLAFHLAAAFSSVTMIFALFVLVYNSGNFDLSAVSSAGVEWASFLVLAAVLLKTISLVGHAWREGQSRLGAASGAFLVTLGALVVGAYPFSRLLLGTFSALANWREVMLWIGLVAAAWSALAALGEDDIRRVVTYGAFSQLMVVFSALALPSPFGATGVVLILVVYTLAISVLFLAVGRVEANTGRRRLSALGGVATAMPTTAVVFVVAALALAAVPPLGAFVGQVMLISTLSQLNVPWPLGLYGVTLALTFFFLLRLFRGAFLGRLGLDLPGETSKLATGTLVVMSILVVGAGLLPFWTMDLFAPVVSYLVR